MNWAVFFLAAFGTAFSSFASASDDGIDESILRGVDPIIQRAVQQGGIPGAVLIVGREGEIVHRKAYGNRSVLDRMVPNTPDTIYDLASLTKPLVTATAVMLLIQDGKLKLDDPLSRILPEAASGAKAGVTLEELLRHRSGLPADNVLADYHGSPAEIWKRIFAVPLVSAPGTAFRYSDVGFLYLQKIVERASGLRLNEFFERRIVFPLKLKNSFFVSESDEKECAQCAPTERRRGRWLVGKVQDPRAEALGGIAGHAGLFSNADDLAVIAQMFLDCGRFHRARILDPATVRMMTFAPPKAKTGAIRGLGWDIETSYSVPRGKIFPIGSFGHTGYTGTSIWIDPSSRSFVILLTNRLHPGTGRKSVSSAAVVQQLRADVATQVARSIVRAPFPSPNGLVGICGSG